MDTMSRTNENKQAMWKPIRKKDLGSVEVGSKVADELLELSDEGDLAA